CEEKPTWNAAVCKGDVGRMNIGAAAGGGGGRGAAAGPGGGGGRGAAAGPGGGGGRGAAGGGFGNRGFNVAPAQPPVILSRNGKDFPVSGATNVRAGTE